MKGTSHVGFGARLSSSREATPFLRFSHAVGWGCYFALLGPNTTPPRPRVRRHRAFTRGLRSGTFWLSRVSRSILPHKKQESRLGDLAGAAWGYSGLPYLTMRYVRSPAVFLEDSIFSPPLLPSRLTNPRMVCFCQPVVSPIWASVAPLA